MQSSDNTSLAKVDLSSSEIAFAILSEKDSPNIGVYIPTLMSEINMRDRVWEKEEVLNDKMIINKNKNFTFETITLCNYYMVEPYDPAVYYTETELGEQVRIKFLDDDIKKCYYFDDTYKMTDVLTEETIDIKERLEKLEKENDALNDKIIKTSSECKELNKTIDILIGQLDAANRRINSLEGRINQMRGVDNDTE